MIVLLSLAFLAGTGVSAQTAPPLETIAALIAGGKYADAEAASRELLADVETRHGAESLPAADVLDLLGESLWRGGKASVPETVTLAERALRIREKLQGPDHVGLAKSLNNLGQVRRLRGDLPGALLHLERALALRRAAFGADHVEVGKSLNNVALVVWAMGDYRRARALYAETLAILEKTMGPEHPGVAMVMNNVAIVLSELGDYAGALALSERSFAIREKALGADHPDLAQGLQTMANQLYRTGDFERARTAYERSAAIYEKSLGPDHPDLALALFNLGHFLAQTGDRDEGLKLYRKSLDIRRRILPAGHFDIGMSQNNLGLLLVEMGELEAARTSLEEAGEILPKALGPDHPFVAETISEMAILLERSGDPRGAAGHFRNALAIHERSLGPDHPSRARILNAWADTQLELGDSIGAVASGLNAERISRAHLRLTTRSFSESQALNYAASRTEGLDLPLTIAARGLPAGPRRDVLDGVVRSRAVVLDEMAARHRTAFGSTDPVVDSLWTRVRDARGRLAHLIIRGVADDSPEAYRAEVDAATREKGAAEEDLARRSGLFQAELARTRIGLADVLAALPANAVLVSLVRYVPSGNAAARPAYVAFVTRPSPERIEVVPLGDAGRIDAAVAAWRSESAVEPSASGAGRPSLPAGEALRKLAWDPLERLVPAKALVLVVPDGALHLVNFGALPSPDGRFLVETGPLFHYLSSERDIIPEAGNSGAGLLAIGDPDYEKAGVAPQAVKAPLYRGGRAGCDRFEDYRFRRLPGTREEIVEIERLWKRERRGEMFTSLDGPDAEEGRVKAGMTGKRIVHLATHGFFLNDGCVSALEGRRGVGGLDIAGTPSKTAARGDNPLLLTGLALAGANDRDRSPRDEDGALTAEEVASLDLRGVEWAVLSACETGAGTVRSGEGVLGLRRAFEIAGVRTLVMSLWAVKDDAAAAWMRELYRARLEKGLSTAESIREASLRVLADRRERGLSVHPSQWAAFIAAGDWR